MKTKLLYILVILFVGQAFGQRKYAADQHFQKFAYKKSADLYKQIFIKGDKSQFILERLGDSYYYNTQTEQAELWYTKLVEAFPEDILPEYYFRYAQALKSNGNYEKSDEIMKKFHDLKAGDSRNEGLETKPDYVAAYNNNEDVEFINLHNVSVNTEYSDFGGFMDKGVFYFASSKPTDSLNNDLYQWNNQPFLELYKAGINVQKLDLTQKDVLELSDQTAFNDIVNTKYHEAAAVITEDGQTMYFTRDNYDGKKRRNDKYRVTHLKLYRAENVNGEWDDIVELPFNSDDYSVGHPTLSKDERTLYFVSDMPGGIGATDIYSVSVERHNYGEPVNLGKGINTEGREMFPHINDDNTLYFSSDGHLGLGALDIFESKLENNSFSEVKNVGAPFNSNMDDFAFFINKEKNQGFLSSNRAGGKGDDDIYSFMISPKPPAPCFQTIAGIVTDARTGIIIPRATVRLVDSKGQVLITQESDANGAFDFGTVPCNGNYTVTGEKLNYSSDREDVVVTDVNEVALELGLSLTPQIVDNEIIVNPIFFDFDQFYIRKEAAEELDKIVTVLNNNPEMIIRIESHTDSRATDSYNITLSDNRAKSTRDYIIANGIASYRIQSAVGFGETQLLNNCDNANMDLCTEEQHQRNRRSKFIIVSGNTNNVRVNDPISVPLKKIDPKPGRF